MKSLFEDVPTKDEADAEGDQSSQDKVAKYFQKVFGGKKKGKKKKDSESTEDLIVKISEKQKK